MQFLGYIFHTHFLNSFTFFGLIAIAIFIILFFSFCVFAHFSFNELIYYLKFITTVLFL